jgi:hypothetical protein
MRVLASNAGGDEQSSHVVGVVDPRDRFGRRLSAKRVDDEIVGTFNYRNSSL